MNKRVLHIFSLLFFLSTAAFSQAVTMVTATGGLSGAAQISGTNNIAILGVQLTKAAGGGNTVTTITVAMTPTPVGKFTNARLYESTDATFSGTGSETQIATGTISATDISFTGAPLTNFDGATAAADDEYFFIVVDVDPGASGSTTPSLASTGVLVSTGTTAGTTITGSTYTLTPPQTTIANLSTGLAASPLQAGATAQGVFGFSLTSNGTQTLSTLNIQTGNTSVGKWSSFSLITSTDNSFATTGDNSAPIGGLTFNATATEIQITGLSQSITTSGTNFFLVADVNAAVNGSTTAVTPSLGSANATATTGTFTGTATGTAYSFAPLLTIANLTTGLASSPLIAGATNQGVFGFSLTSSGSQTVTVLNVQLSSTPASKWTNYRLITSTDASYATTGDNSAPIGGLTFTPSASQVAITGLSQVITSGTNYFLVVDVDPSVTGGTIAVLPSLAGANITITTGGGIATGTATGTNYSFSLATATFTEITAGTAPVIGSNVLSAGSTLQVLTGFAVTSNGTQTITSIGFNYTGLGSQFTDEYLYRSTVAGSVGTQVQADNSPDGNFGSLTETINSSTVYFYLVVDVANSVNSATASVTTAPTQANITVAGNKNSLSISRTFTFATSQNSNIVLNGGTTDNIDYISKRTGTPLTSGNSVSLATFRIQDGGGSSDPDNSSTTLTALQIQLTNFAMVRRIALFDGASIIAGTQQDVSSGTITFSGLTLSASDNNTKDFTVRATFQNSITDNVIVDVTIQSATANSSGSGFAAGNAGGASSTSEPSADANKIEVTASALAFTANPANTAINTPFGLVLQAKDAQNNIDLDYNSQVALTATGGAGTLTVDAAPPAPIESLTPTLSAGVYTWTTLQLNQSGTYTLTASDDAYDDNFTDPTATVTITSSASNISQPSTLNLCYGGSFQTLGNIQITETDLAGFSNTGSFSIALPTGFVFDTGTNPTLTMSNSATTFSSVGFTGNNIVQFNYSITAPTGLNTLTISGLRIRYPGSTAPSGGNQITRAGGTATIAGVVAGTQLATVTATLGTPPVGLGFTVVKVNPTDTDVNPNETRFSQSSNAVRLVGSHPGGVFSGPGVAFVSGEYRFNPQSLSLSPPLYDIVYTYTDPSGQNCQFTVTKQFEIYSTNITGLNTQYCSNDPDSPVLHVSSAYINARFGANFVLKKFVYWNYDPVFGTYSQADITPLVANTALNLSDAGPTQSVVFNPDFNAYAQVYVRYASPGMWVGFVVENTITLATQVEWTFILVRNAPNVTIANTVTSFCSDDIAVTLVGNPPNSDITGDDFFSETGPGSPVAVSLSNPRVWSFSPSALGGSGVSNITYTYRDPITGCSATSASVAFTVNTRPTAVDNLDITKVQPVGVAGTNTTIQLCQGTSGTFSFTATVPGYNYRWYENSVSPANLKGTAATFVPPVNTSTPGSNPFIVTRELNGCESTVANLAVSVVVVASPAAPVPNFGEAIRAYCVDPVVDPIDPLHLGVPGTALKWYNSSGSVIAGIANPNLPTTAELSISASAANVYSYSVSQTEGVNNCEGPKTPLTVTIKALPVVSISAAPGFNASKICTTGGEVRFIAKDLSDPSNPAPNGLWSGIGALNDFPSLGEVELDPLTRGPGTYTLEYEYENSANCTNTGTLDITILPTITPSISILNVCEGSPSQIVNNSSINNGAGQSSTIQSVRWVFGDGSELPRDTVTETIDPLIHSGNTLGLYFNPRHIYPNTGTFQVGGDITTSDGCTYSFTQTPANVNVLPVANFISTNVCSNSQTTFTASANIPIQTYTWDFAMNDVLANASATSSTPSPTSFFTYTTTGQDIVRLIASTSVGCRDTVDKPIFMVPSYTPITPANSYSESFATSGGWIAGGTNSSWQLAIPTGAPAPVTGQAWDTNPSGPNNAAENSWVLSGCFNLAGVTKPVISLDIWSDVPSGVDGAVLQYNITGNIEDNVPGNNDTDGDWKVVGEVGVGINWYDENGISNSPGSQTTISAGWTGKYANWKRAIFKLDNIRTDLANAGDLNKPVVFRIAFSSLQPRGEGFTFDNVFIGERSRIVLLENFTNSSSNTQVHNDNFYRNFGTAAELVKIQYHTAFPGNDPINDLNEQMNNSRAAFYGITESPTIRMDGDFRSGTVASWLNSFYADRVLTPSDIKLSVTATKVDKEVKINTTVENTTTQTLPLAGAHVFTVIVQKSVIDPTLLGSSGNSEFVYVAKGMLPSAAGETIPADLTAGATYVVPELTWRDSTGGNAIVVFVQSLDGNKNVYQAFLLDNPPVPNLITGTEDPEYVKNIHVYPNPAGQVMNIELPAAAVKPTPVALIDAFGKTVYHSEFRMGEKIKTVSTDAMADGIYMLQLTTPGGSKAVRKVMVKH